MYYVLVRFMSGERVIAREKVLCLMQHETGKRWDQRRIIVTFYKIAENAHIFVVENFTSQRNKECLTSIWFKPIDWNEYKMKLGRDNAIRIEKQ